MLKLKSWGVCDNETNEIEVQKMKTKMTKAALLHQVRNLTANQCRQLGVAKAFDGAPALKAVTAWLGDSQLYGEDGSALDVEAIFAEGDPAEVVLHSGLAATEEEAAEEVTEEIAADVAAEEPAQTLAMRSIIRDELANQKSQRRGLPASNVRVTSTRKKSDHFDTDEDQYLAGQWLGAKVLKRPSAIKWWNNNAPSGLKAQSEGTNSAGGFLVPDPLEAAIVDARRSYGIARAISQVYPMTADTLNVPKLTSGSTVYVNGESTAITESSAVWANVGLTCAKRGCLMKWSAELGADALFSMAEVLTDYMGRALGIEEDNCLINGDGSSGMGSVTGLDDTGHVAVSGAGSTWGDLTLANLVTTAGTLPDRFHQNAQWIMSRQFYTQVVLRVIAAAGGNTIDSLGVGSTGAQLLGYPIQFSDSAPTSTATSTENCWFGDFKYGVVFGDRSGIEIATSEHVNFAEDQINIRATSRYDIQVVTEADGDADAYVSLNTTS